MARPRWIRVSWTIAALAGCSSAMDAKDADGLSPLPFGDGAQSCPHDPDSFATGERVECSDYWVCEASATRKRCATPGADYPDTSHEWSCQDDHGTTVCRGSSVPDGGAGEGWTCEQQGDLVVCVDNSPDYPSEEGDGPWDCYYRSEFRVCDSSGGGGDDGDEGESFCFLPDSDPNATPLVRGQYRFETINGLDAVHVSLIFDESFVDNTYGVNASEGWDRHTFRDLVGSDHAEVSFSAADGSQVLHAKFDYITASDTAASGYDSLGVSGGDGRMLEGDASAVLATTSSLDRNFNELGCIFTTDSPTPAQCPGWESRVIYEMWIARDAFGASGFGAANLAFVHASPSKVDSTVYVHSGPCL